MNVHVNGDVYVIEDMNAVVDEVMNVDVRVYVYIC